VSKFSEKRLLEGQARKPGPRWLWIGIALGLVLLAWSAYYFFYYASRVSTLDGFAECLTARGVQMYGTWWCPHCADQKEMFGYAFRRVDYIECSPPGQRGETEACKRAGVKNFPTWQFPDGSRTEGAQPLALLSQKTGCRLP
jgi:hypothetical protein